MKNRLIYSINSIPDLTLSKYQMLAENGIEGILEMQTQFLRLLHSIALLGDIGIHFLFLYKADGVSGKKIKIYLEFSNTGIKADYADKIKKIVKSSGVRQYFGITEVKDNIDYEVKFSSLSVLHKKERFLQTVINGEENYFYVVPNWEMNDEARLFSLFKMMESFDEDCCYRVDLYTENNFNEQIHKSFSKPLSYLRNIKGNDKGLSEFSKLQKDKSDPNAEETLHQYEDWIKRVDTSVVFRCRIAAFSNDKVYSKILLNCAVTESLHSGNCEIVDESGNFDIDYLSEKKPIGYCSDYAPKSLNMWSTTFTAEEIAAFVRLPVLYDGEVIEIPKETAAKQEENGIVLGNDTNNHEVVVPENFFPKHMFVCGVPGSGKTNTMLHLANSLWNYRVKGNDGNVRKLNIPFLVLEPAKREYRELALFDIPELLIFSPSANTRFQLKINPFEFPKGLTLSEHIGKLCQVFEGAFPIAPPAPFILDRAIQAVYESHGWNVKDINTGEKEYPILSELYAQFEKELLNTQYDSEIQGNIRSVLEMRIGSLLRREMKEIFDVRESILSPEEWLRYPIIVELEALGEGPANFVTLLLCTLIRETIKVNPLADKGKKVRHVIFIEEAHNLIAPQATVQDGMDSNPKIAATAFIVKMLAEVRALREGIIIADQLPTAMAPEVIKNTNIKLVHRLTSADDRELVGSTMSASPMQMESMATYTSGQALFSYEKLLRPFEMQVSLVEEHGTSTPSDEELYELMTKKPCYRELCRREENKKFELLKSKASELNEKEILAIKKLLSFDYKSMQSSDIEKLAETFSRTLNGIELLKRRYLWECSLISEQYIEKSRKDSLCGIIDDFGERLRRELQNIIMCCY